MLPEPVQANSKSRLQADIILPLARTNQRPTDAQRQALAAFVAQKNEDIDKLNKDISRRYVEAAGRGKEVEHLRHEIRELQQTRHLRASQIKTYQCFFAPVRLLPIEILGIIFSYVITSIPSHEYAKRTMFSRWLSEVCSGWRYAAHATPCLWNTLTLDLNSMGSGACVPPWALGLQGLEETSLSTHITSWFHRSQTAPLTLAIFASNDDPGLLVADCIPALTILFQRFSTLRLEVRNLEHLTQFLSLPSEGASVLQTICIRATCLNVMPEITVFTSSVFLRNVCFDFGCTLPTIEDSSSLGLPWSQLQRLDLTASMTFQALADIIFQAESLVTASFDVHLHHGKSTTAQTGPSQ
ncbi:hypothetical protein DXG01_010748 [Tephrocybe rancida]|nr:hypothetical protein DXG01_010748 [Tephrocybe rancida]